MLVAAVTSERFSRSKWIEVTDSWNIKGALSLQTFTFTQGDPDVSYEVSHHHLLFARTNVQQ